MATIHVNRGGTSLGTFSEEEVREGLSSGRFTGTDLGWREGMAQWRPLSQMPEFGSAAPSPPLVSATLSAPNAAPEQKNKNEQASFVIAVIALCFAALAAAWSFVGGACCGWAGWGWAFVGLVLASVSLILKPSAVGWWALGLSVFAVLWVFVWFFFIVGIGAAGGAASPHL